MSQGLAILGDSLRELRSRSLFWISLGISAVVAVALFGVIGFDETGWRILWFQTNESDTLRAGTAGARDLMAWMFSLFVRWWLCWGAIILALLSTASILPGFVASGSIEITLAKPISRVRLFLWKVGGALLFVLAQTLIAVLLAYLLLGIKIDLWMHAILWTIPLIVIQFFYLYAVSALAAVVTRSTVASLLVTIVFWGLVSIVQFASNQLDSAVAQSASMIAPLEKQIAAVEEEATSEGRELTRFEQSRIDSLASQRDVFAKQLGWVEPYQRPLNTAERLVPKTGDVQKIIANLTRAPTLNELLRGMGAMDGMMRPAGFDADEWESMQDAGIAGNRAIRRVDRAESLGSSLAFSLLVLGAATLLFTRRDF